MSSTAFYDLRLHEPEHARDDDRSTVTALDPASCDTLLPRRSRSPMPEPAELDAASKILDDIRRMKLEILELEKGHLRDMKIIRSALTARGTQTSNSNRSMLENESTVSRWLRDARAGVHGRTVSDSTVLSTVTALSLTADPDATGSTAPSSPIAPSVHVGPHPASEEDATNVPPVKREERDEDVQANDNDHDHDRTVVSSTSNTSPPSPSPAPSFSPNPVCTSEERDAGAQGYDLLCKTTSHVPPPSALEEVGDYTLNFMLAESLLNTPAPSTAYLPPPPPRGFRALVARVVRSVRRR